MQAVGATVDNMDTLDRLSPLLYDLGHQHCKIIGFDADYFDLFFDALMKVWRERLKQRFTGDVETAWKIVFLFILRQLRDGMQPHDARPSSLQTPETACTFVH